MRKITYTTLLGQRVDLDVTASLEKFYSRILAAENGAAAEALAYGADPSISHPLTPIGRNAEGVASWSAETLRDPRWAYLQDAVARCRAAHGELDVGAVMSAATWTVAEAARSLGVSEQAVRKLVADGDLPAVVIDGRNLIDRRVVEAYATTGTRAGSTERVPALYARIGASGPAEVLVCVVGPDGREMTGELLSSVDGVDELVFVGWARAAVRYGKGGPVGGGADKCRGAVIEPRHGRAARTFGLDGLAVVTRAEVIESANNRAAAHALFDAFKSEVRRGR
jgi:excisionase family DNA binding protein